MILCSTKRTSWEVMKNRLIVVASLFALSCSLSWVAHSQNGPKVKIKGGKLIERDKSKPVRKAIEAWYDLNIEAFNKRDVAAIMALRTEDFHTTTPDGKVNTRADMEAYTKRLLDRIDHFISQNFEIGTIDVQGDLASADVSQKTVRMQRLPDGTLHKVEARVVQRETWKHTAQGWKMYTVDNIRDSSILIDDKPYQPAPQ
jgi:ketosteroid isomerase-like protein